MSIYKSISFAELTLLNREFIKVVVNPNSEIHPAHLDEIWSAYDDLVGKDSKFTLLTILPEDLYISPETKKLWANPQRSARKNTEAFVINGLGLKLIANFVVKFHKPQHNVRYFNSEEKALNWLVDNGIETNLNIQTV